MCLTHRYYDPGTGKFINRDPIGYEGGANLYGFADGNPVNESDPEGTDALATLEKDAEAVVHYGTPAVRRVGNFRVFLMSVRPSFVLSTVGLSATLFFASTKTVADDSTGPGSPYAIAEAKRRSSRSARRQAMRKAGIPTSQQPNSQMNTMGGRQYVYTNGQREMAVTEHQADDKHPNPHWEAGVAKSPFQIDSLGRRQYYGGKGTAHQKVKVDFAGQ